MVSQTYYQMINNDNIKWNVLVDMLDAIGWNLPNCQRVANWILM
jgi:predicted type IV restriction endonuclease